MDPCQHCERVPNVHEYAAEVHQAKGAPTPTRGRFQLRDLKKALIVSSGSICCMIGKGTHVLAKAASLLYIRRFRVAHRFGLISG
jgi:hypothetical protein